MRALVLAALVALPAAAGERPAPGLYCPAEPALPILVEGRRLGIDGLDCRDVRFDGGRVAAARCVADGGATVALDEDLAVLPDGSLRHDGRRYVRRSAGPPCPYACPSHRTAQSSASQEIAMRERELTPIQIVQRRAEVERALVRIASGEIPTAAQLRRAPHIDSYHRIPHPHGGEPALAGDVVGHPRLGSGFRVTGPIVAEGPGWIRTASRFFRLGAPATEAYEARVERERAARRQAPAPDARPVPAEEAGRDVDGALAALPRF